MRGIDYAWANPKPSPTCLISNGVEFVMRYFSNDPAKDLTTTELHNLLSHEIPVGVVWETVANRMLGGSVNGEVDAMNADGRANAMGMTGIPIYFACDFDATPDNQAPINSYLDGVASKIGRKRTGMYSGYWPLKRAFDAGKVVWGWQTYAWSGGNWDTRAQLRQVQNGVTVCATSCDWNQSQYHDFGQWPRPGAAPPSPAPITKTPPFPYPADNYLGVSSPDPRGHSGYYSATDNRNVKTWQGQMARRGWGISVDGYYGNSTRDTCISFQTEKGLSVDGMVGPKTWTESWTAPIT